MRLRNLFTQRNVERAVLALALALPILAMTHPALADENQTTWLSKSQAKVNAVYTYARSTVFLGGGLGIIVLAVLAFFGRFQWGRFFALAGGIVLVGVTTELISFLSDSGVQPVGN